MALRGSPLAALARDDSSRALVPVAVLIAAAAWLIASPFALDHADHPHGASDIISGITIGVLAFAAALFRRAWIAWLAGCVGIWLILAPVLLWSPDLDAYLSTTLTGILVAFEGLVIPLSRPLPGPANPDGWSYNPSAWSQRVPVILLATASAGVAGYLAGYQLGFYDSIWDPVFGDGTERVLASDVSRAWPVSDAGLGATMFVLDAIVSGAGDRRRWRTMPWLVTLFGVMIIPVGIVSIVLVILQPVAVGAWCTWCLVTAAATLIMIPLAVDEVAATLQLLRQARRRGASVWRVFWLGDRDRGSPEPMAPYRDRAWPPIGLAVIGLAGIWWMIQPDVMGTAGAAADSARVTGALAVVIAVVAVSELARPVRLLAIPLALWIALEPWILDGAPPAAGLAAAITACVLVLAAAPAGKRGARHGTADRLVGWPRRFAAR